MRQPDDGNVRHFRRGDQQVLDLARTEGFALADDHVLDTPGDGQIALRIKGSEVAGTQEAVLVEGGLIRSGTVEVAAHHLRTLDAYLAVNDPYLDAGGG